MVNKIINAISLHSGGGLTYLYFLNHYLDNESNVLILDYRVKSKIIFKKSKIFFIKKGIFRNIRIFSIRLFFYLKNYLNFNKNQNVFTEIYLNGIPPFIRFSKTKTFIFCQNRLVFEKIPKLINLNFNLNFNLIKSKLIVIISKTLFNLFIRRKDIIIVQTDSMLNLLKQTLVNKIILQKDLWGEYDKHALKRIININKVNVNKGLEKYLKTLKENNIIFFYPASYYEHKNHRNLIEAFNLLSHRNIKPYKLILTLDETQFKEKIRSNTKNIIFLGNLNYFEILDIYRFVDYMIFPSFSESYGLPLIEAKHNNIKIIASDLPYVFDVCEPFMIFNPLIIQEIYQKISCILEN